MDGHPHGRSARSLPRIRLARGPSPQRTRSHRLVPASTGCGSRRKLRSGATGSSRGRSGKPSEEKGRCGHALLRFGMVVPESAWSGENGYRPRCNPGRCGRLGHAEMDQVVAMAKTTYEGRVEVTKPPPLDQFLPPGPGPIDRLAFGHQDRRPRHFAWPSEPQPSIRAARSRRLPWRRADRGRVPDHGRAHSPGVGFESRSGKR